MYKRIAIKTLERIKKIPALLRRLTFPFQIGFVQGHSYLSKKQVLRIQQVLNSDDNKEVVYEYEERMTSLIGSGFGISFAAGRMAFYSLLKALNIGRGDEVVLQGSTCSVMPNAVWRTGATPVFADIDKETFGSDPVEIEKRISSRTKLIVAQHSFGIPCNIPAISKLGNERGIFVMEDCAITLDSAIDDTTVGNWSDAAMFSTDHSKPLNTLIGGFLYTKDESLYEKIRKYTNTLPHLSKGHQHRLFKQFLFERKNYTPKRYPRSLAINYARKLIKKLEFGQEPFVFLEADYTKNPSSDLSYPYPAKMPPFLSQIGLYELDRWKNEKNKRKAILNSYLRIARQSGLVEYLPKAYADQKIEIVPLRFVFEHPETEALMSKMERYIDIGWTWFRKPIICCPDGPESLGYVPGSCLNAETAGKNIINWPCVVEENWEDELLKLFKYVVSLH